MNNWKQSPFNSLVSKYVDCYWLIEKLPQDTGLDYPKLNPDPAGTLILAPEKQTYSYQLNGVETQGIGSHLLLPNTSTVTIDHTKPFVILGVKFHVGALYSLKFDSDVPLTDAVIEKQDCLSSELNDTQLLSKASEHIALTCKTMDEQLLPWLQKSYEDTHSELVRRIISIFQQTPVADMGNALGCSQRTVERACRRVTGVTLKQYESMMRLEELLTFLYQQEDKGLSWADVAAQFEFSDQPHLIRYLKATIGVTPNDYLKHRDITIDVYGDFE